jgi:N-acetyl-gamma-glutamyl-phosphate reductase
VQAQLKKPTETQQLLDQLATFYAGAAFVQVTGDAPHIKDVVASNYARLSGISRNGTAAVMCAIDNLTKGAAGGAVQWMNRMYGLPETSGLTAPAPGWT